MRKITKIDSAALKLLQTSGFPSVSFLISTKIVIGKCALNIYKKRQTFLTYPSFLIFRRTYCKDKQQTTLLTIIS
jgi:hypothetical protein